MSQFTVTLTISLYMLTHEQKFLSGKQLLDVFLDLERGCGGRVPLNDLSLFINQELLKVPFNETTQESSCV